MKCAVFDTWVDRREGGKMHFDIIVPENTTYEKVVEFGKTYLQQKGQEGQPLHPKNCVFCHTELAGADFLHSIEERGYHILEMQGCE